MQIFIDLHRYANWFEHFVIHPRCFKMKVTILLYSFCLMFKNKLIIFSLIFTSVISKLMKNLPNWCFRNEMKVLLETVFIFLTDLEHYNIFNRKGFLKSCFLYDFMSPLSIRKTAKNAWHSKNDHVSLKPSSISEKVQI